MLDLQSPKLRKRILSALVLAPFTLWVLWQGGALFDIVVVAGACLAAYEWIGLSVKTSRRGFFTAFGLIYILCSAWCCYTLRTEYGAALTLLLFVMVWASDIDAYFTGKIIGGPKLAVSISPNKTWAGLAGATVSPAVLGIIFYIYNAGFAIPQVLGAMLVGAVIGVSGQVGDLVVSFVKRQADVKDSGNLIPGHGGLLDRIDALLLALPVFVLILENFPHVFGQ